MEIQVFNHPQFGAIRTMTMPDGQIGFVGKDVAEVLGYSNASKAVMMHVESDDKMQQMITIPSDSQNGNVWQKTKTTFINESGLYSLILSSKLPQAREFKHWVLPPVLPTDSAESYRERHDALLSPLFMLFTEVLSDLGWRF